MEKIVNVKEYGGGVERAIEYFHSIWGSNKSYMFYHDAIMHSSMEGKPLPRFYLMLRDEEIIGCYGLVTNDFVSRHDLYPWLAALYIDEKERGRELGRRLLEHGEKEAANLGFEALYLSTGHDGYYERYGWKRIEDGYEPDGSATRIYEKDLKRA